MEESDCCTKGQWKRLHEEEKEPVISSIPFQILNSILVFILSVAGKPSIRVICQKFVQKILNAPESRLTQHTVYDHLGIYAVLLKERKKARRVSVLLEWQIHLFKAHLAEHSSIIGLTW